ncbi:hypothetical protein DRW42_13195 [Pedobacter miscanthi]|uniref:histidine kinase n=2 Tax=Pedobacter miscanthi TaxID=2259170 RepID=A0A366KYL6_9SPHI|nr:hypothetical protein DRW42_13195 [Pedobacter miscanthi]
MFYLSGNIGDENFLQQKIFFIFFTEFYSQSANSSNNMIYLKKMRFSFRSGLFQVCIMALCLICYSANVNAQYFPTPQPVGVNMENGLLTELSRTKDELNKINVLLSLSSLYYFRPERKPVYIARSIKYADDAARISKKLKNEEKFSESKYLIGLGLLCDYKFKAAEGLLKELDEKRRCDLLVSLGFYLTNSRVGVTKDLLSNSRRILSLAIPLSQKLKNRRNELIARQCLALTAFQEGENDKYIAEIENVLADYKKFNVPGISYAYYLTAEMYNLQGKNDKAMFYLRAGIKEMQKNNDIMSGGDLYKLLAIVFKQESEFNKELEAYQKSLTYYKVYPGIWDMYFAIQGVAYGLIHLKQEEKALKYLDSILVGNQPGAYKQKRTIFEMYANIYLALKRYDKAEIYYLKRFNVVKENNDLGFSSFDRMGYFYIESKQYAKAKPYLDSAMHRIDHSTTPNSISSLKYRLFMVDSAAGNYLSAIKNLSLTHNFSDSVAREKKRTEINKLLVEYEDDKKQSEIAALKQKSQLDLANIKQASLIRNFLIIGAVVLLIVALVFYRQYRTKLFLNAEILSKNEKQEVLLDRLNRLLSEKEWLLKEVHHRVKNNLHTVISLLNTQAEFLKDDALAAIENSQHRIYVMSLIHQKLYASDEIQSIDMVEYVRELITYLKDSYGELNNIEYISEVDPLSLEVGKAMPIGLIINEAVTNSIKYAFPNKEKGMISIVMKKNEDTVTMRISDNGIGIPDRPENEKLSSLGLKLIAGLSADINGSLKVENKNGTVLTLTFSSDFLKSSENVML